MVHLYKPKKGVSERKKLGNRFSTACFSYSIDFDTNTSDNLKTFNIQVFKRADLHIYRVIRMPLYPRNIEVTTLQ